MAGKKKIRQINRTDYAPGVVVPIEKDEEVVFIDEKEVSDICNCSDNGLAMLNEQVNNIINCLSELISLTGTGRILEKYGIKKYDVTKEDLSIGKFVSK